jgi:hypothetical protein
MPRIIHIFSRHLPARAGDMKRLNDAQRSWQWAYRHAGDWLHVPVADKDMKRNAATALGDRKPIPFLREVIDTGIEMSRKQCDATPDDVVFFCNSDVHVAEDIADAILAQPVSYASRKDFMFVPRNCTRQVLAKGSPHPGIDAASFPVKLWPKIRREMPDMLIARSRFDLVLRSVLKRNGGVEIMDCIGHVLHGQEWLASESEPSGLHNIDLFWKYEKDVEKLWNF